MKISPEWEIRSVKEKSIGTRIRKIREGKDYTQDNIAVDIPMSPSAYSKIERGETNIPLDRLIRIAEVLEVHVSEFFTDVPGPGKFKEPRGEYSHAAGCATKGELTEVKKIVEDVVRQVNIIQTLITLLGIDPEKGRRDESR